MRYLNQLEYEDIPYPTDILHPESNYARNGNVAIAGCGLCSVCMVVDYLTGIDFPLTECRDLSVSCGANRDVGTDMKILGPAVAELFHLHLRMTDDAGQMAAALHEGGAAIVHVGGDREGHTGIFSEMGHYIVVLDETDGLFHILDPDWTPEKYTKPPQSTKVTQQGMLLYASAEVLETDSVTRSPAYYLFQRS